MSERWECRRLWYPPDWPSSPRTPWRRRSLRSHATTVGRRAYRGGTRHTSSQADHTHPVTTHCTATRWRAASTTLGPDSAAIPGLDDGEGGEGPPQSQIRSPSPQPWTARECYLLPHATHNRPRALNILGGSQVGSWRSWIFLWLALKPSNFLHSSILTHTLEHTTRCRDTRPASPINRSAQRQPTTPWDTGLVAGRPD